MLSLDTNILVRWLVADDDRQTRRARQLFESAALRQDVLFVPVTVVLELEWVLRSRYRYDKGSALQALTALLETQELELQNEPAVERALHACRQPGADFADCLHAGLCASAGQSPLLSFDVKAARVAGIEWVDA